MPTYPLTFPSHAPATEKLTPVRSQVSFTGLSGQQQTVTNFSQWAVEWQWPTMSHAAGAACAAFLNNLNGQAGSFWYQPRNAGVSGLANKNLPGTAYAYSTVLVAQGWTANQASGVQVGQFMQIGTTLQATQLVQVTAVSGIADAQGHVTIEFAPQLRRDYAQGTAVIFGNPAGVFRLNSSETPSFTLDPDGMATFGPITAVEVL